MTTIQKRKILQRMSDIESDINEIRRCRSEIATNGYASATISSGGGSKSYTRLDLSKLTEIMQSLQSEMKSLRNMLAKNGNQDLWKNVLVVYS